MKKNQVVALVGKSGCGKTTIVSLIERFYDPTGGEVRYDGRNIKMLDPLWFHSKISIVSQEPILFSGTIRQNLVYGLNDWQFTEEDIIDCCKKANALDFIQDKDSFPKGFDTVVGERGVKLSGGQKQRISIARALLRKPKVLLLDEATSALDTESEI